MASPTCPNCGQPTAPSGPAPSAGELVLSTLSQILGALQSLFGVTAPPTTSTIERYSQAESNITVGPNAIPLRVTPPQGVRTWSLTNLSTSKSITYWFTNSVQRPPHAYRTLNPSTSVSRDTAPAYLTVAFDPASTDAGIEVEWWTD